MRQPRSRQATPRHAGQQHPATSAASAERPTTLRLRQSPQSSDLTARPRRHTEIQDLTRTSRTPQESPPHRIAAELSMAHPQTSDGALLHHSRRGHAFARGSILNGCWRIAQRTASRHATRSTAPHSRPWCGHPYTAPAAPSQLRCAHHATLICMGMACRHAHCTAHLLLLLLLVVSLSLTFSVPSRPHQPPRMHGPISRHACTATSAATHARTLLAAACARERHATARHVEATSRRRSALRVLGAALLHLVDPRSPRAVEALSQPHPGRLGQKGCARRILHRTLERGHAQAHLMHCNLDLFRE